MRVAQGFEDQYYRCMVILPRLVFLTSLCSNLLYMPEDGTCVYFCAVFLFACMRFEHNSYLDAFSYGDGETCNGAGATVVYNNTIYSPTGNISVSALA